MALTGTTSAMAEEEPIGVVKVAGANRDVGERRMARVARVVEPGRRSGSEENDLACARAAHQRAYSPSDSLCLGEHYLLHGSCRDGAAHSLRAGDAARRATLGANMTATQAMDSPSRWRLLRPRGKYFDNAERGGEVTWFATEFLLCVADRKLEVRRSQRATSRRKSPTQHHWAANHVT